MKLGEVHALRNISPLSRSSAAASKLFNCRQKKLLLVHFHSANNTMIFTLTRLPILFSILTFAAFLPRNKTRPTMRSGDKQQTTNNMANKNRTLTIGNHHGENVSSTSSIERWRPRNSSWRSMIACAENRKHSPK